jgi:hypothetical protein
MDGLDVIYRVRETRPVWKTRPIALGLTLLAGTLLLRLCRRQFQARRGPEAPPRSEATLGPTRLSSSLAVCICAVLLYHFVINAH